MRATPGANEQAETLVAVHGIVDGLFLRSAPWYSATRRANAPPFSMDLGVSMAVLHEGARPFYRATAEAALSCLAGIRDLSATAVDRPDR